MRRHAPLRRAIARGFSGRKRREPRRGLRLRFEPLEGRWLLSGGSLVGGAEQLFVYMLNRARHDPVAYQIEQDVPVDLSYVASRGPLAVNDSLCDSSGFHAGEMAANDYFGHQSAVTGDWPNKMARDHGYQLPSWWSNTANYIESIAAGTILSTAAETLKTLIVDQGVSPPGHRIDLLGIDDFAAGHREIGVGHAYNDSAYYDHYWAIHHTRQDTADVFLTGVVFNDTNGNSRYDLGEGLPDVAVTAGQLGATTNAAGGWSLEVGTGTYTVTASGAGFPGTPGTTVVVGSDNVEIDFISGQSWAVVNFDNSVVPPVANDDVAWGQESSLSIAVLANDTDADGSIDPGTVGIATQPAHGTAQVHADGSVTYTAEAGFFGADSFGYTVRDHDGATSNEAAVSVVVAEPLGTVDSVQRPEQDPSAGDLWYGLSTTRPGYLTVEAVSEGPVDAAGLRLYNANLEELTDAADGHGHQRVDYYAGGGEQYYVKLAGTAGSVDLRLANLLSIDGGTVTVYGTDGDDVFACLTQPQVAILANGIRYEPVQVERVDFVGGGGGQDTVSLYDSAGDDTLVGWPGGGMMTGAALVQTASGFEVVFAYATAGGHDSVKLYDSPGDDVFVGTRRYGGVSGSGFAVHTQDFEEVRGYATQGGYDQAKLYDSPGDDRLYATPVEAALFGDGFYNRIKFVGGAHAVHAYATGGGNDVAELHGSAADEVFYGTVVEGGMIGEGFYNRAKFFEEVHGYAGDGNDVAKLYDSAGDDTFVATAEYGGLYSSGLSRHAHYFDAVHAFGTKGGYDVAKLYDSPGDDLFYGDAVEGALFRRGHYYNRAKFFERVDAFATGGGYDRAELYGSPGDDTFVSTDVDAALFGTGFYNRVKYFEEGNGHAVAGGNDQAHLFDSALADHLEAANQWARLSNETSGFSFFVEDFSYVRATSSGPGDTKSVAQVVDFLLNLVGTWESL